MNCFVIPIISTLLIANTSLANPVLNSSPDGYHRPSHTWIPTVTKSEWGHAAPKIPRKPKLLRSNPHRLTAIRFQDVDPLDAPDDEYLCSAVGRLRVVHEPESDDVSEHVRARLLVARLRALKKYQEVWS